MGYYCLCYVSYFIEAKWNTLIWYFVSYLTDGSPPWRDYKYNKSASNAEEEDEEEEEEEVSYIYLY